MSQLDEIIYHLFESSGNSMYVRSDHVNRPLYPEEAKNQIKALILEIIKDHYNGMDNATFDELIKEIEEL